MSTGTKSARRAVLRRLVMPAAAISLAAGLGPAASAPRAAADAVSTAGSAVFRAGPASPVTAYVVNENDFGAGTVTPIATATNTAGPPIKVGSDAGPIAITPDGKTAYVVNAGTLLGHGDPDRDRDQHRRAADHGRT